MQQRETETFYNASQKLWSGPKRKLFYGEDVTLGEIALFVLSRNEKKVIQVMDTTGEELTAGQLLRDGKVIACNLMDLNIGPGDVVGISANNTPHLTAVTLAALLCGAPTHALFPGFDKESIQLVFKVTTPKVIFCDVENYETIKEAMTELQSKAEIFVLNGTVEGARNVKELMIDRGDADLNKIRFPCIDVKGDDTAAILCSSGTTGIPKGACCSHKALINQPMYNYLSPDSVIFTFSTLYWASGLWTFTAALLYGVKRVITDAPFTPEYFLQLVEKHQITDMITGPHQMAQLLEHPRPDLTRRRLTSIRSILCGGSKVPAILTEKMNDLLGDDIVRPGFCVAYGMSELAGMVSINDRGPHQRRDGTEGKLMPNTEVRIVNKEDGTLCDVNEAGIVHIRTPFKWSGYYRNPEASSKAYADGGWLISGDIGFFDGDGFLHICTRDSDVFKSNNFQIYPQQIEEIILQLPGVLEACVFGVPDFVAANLTACAVVRSDTETGRVLNAAMVEEHVKRKMADIYHIKAGVHFVASLPKTGSGKVQRRKVLDMIKSPGK